MSRLTALVPTLLLIAVSCRLGGAAEGVVDPQPAPVPAPSDTPAPAPAATPTTDAKLTVEGAREATYRSVEAQTATRTLVPISQTPLAVQTVPKQVFADQGDLRLKDVIRNVSSVAPSKTEGNAIQFESAFIRGFSQVVYMDGLQTYAMPPLELAGVERIEVLKGPASAVYGGMEPGGVINIVPKVADFNPRGAVSGTVGSYDLYRGEVDANAPLGDEVAFRVSAAYQDNDSYRDFLHQRSFFVGPSLTWAPSEQTRITLYAWYQDLERPMDNGVVFTAAGSPVGPISRNLAGESTSNSQDLQDSLANVLVEHAVTNDLTVRGRVLAHYFEGSFDCIRWGATNANNTITPNYDASYFHDVQFDVVGDVDYKVRFGATQHEFLLGTELYRNDYHYDRRVVNLTAINIFNPVYPSGPYNPVPGVAQQHTQMNTVAGYLQDQMTALDGRLHLLAGGRIDRVDQDHVAFQTGNRYEQVDVGFSGRIGALYEVTPWLSPYANAAQSFNPNGAGSNLTFSGGQLDPTTGEQYEGGLKFNAMDEKVVLTTAVYQITKDDVAIGDPDHPGFNLNGGTLRSRGFEADVSGQVTSDLQVIASYAYTDTEVIRSTSLPVGAPFLGIPENSGSLWLAHTFHEGVLHDFGVGAGVFAADARAGNNAATFELPGYARFDAGAWYTFPIGWGARVRLQANVQNVFDTTYYESSSSAGQVQPGAPLTLLGKCSVLF